MLQKTKGCGNMFQNQMSGSGKYFVKLKYCTGQRPIIA